MFYIIGLSIIVLSCSFSQKNDYSCEIGVFFSVGAHVTHMPDVLDICDVISIWSWVHVYLVLVLVLFGDIHMSGICCA